MNEIMITIDLTGGIELVINTEKHEFFFIDKNAHDPVVLCLNVRQSDLLLIGLVEYNKEIGG